MARSQNIRASLCSIKSEYQQEFNIILISYTVHRLILADTIKLLHVMAAFWRYPWAQQTRLVSSLLYLLLAFLVKEVSLISFQANRNNLL